MLDIKSMWEKIIDQMPVGILMVKVNDKNPKDSVLIYYNKQANRELDLNLGDYLDKTMPDLLISKKGILEKYSKVVETQKSRKLVAKLKEKNMPAINFSILLLPAGEDYVAAVYQRIDDRIKTIELSKKLEKTTEELRENQETVQDLMSELKKISIRIKKNGYKE